jgi:hypothetical protein
MDYKWKINGRNLVVHNKKSGEIFLIEKKLIPEFEVSIDKCVKEFVER